MYTLTGLSRRIEVGDHIRSPEFARGYRDVMQDVGLTFVGQGSPEVEKYRHDDPGRGTAEYVVTRAYEETRDIGGIFLRGLTTRRWAVQAVRTLPGGTVETIAFTQFCTSLLAPLDWYYVIPVVEFVGEAVAPVEGVGPEARPVPPWPWPGHADPYWR